MTWSIEVATMEPDRLARRLGRLARRWCDDPKRLQETIEAAAQAQGLPLRKDDDADEP